MGKFCNKCGSPVDGVFCVKCGADTRLTPSPPPSGTLQASSAESVSGAASASPVAASANAPAAKFCNKCGAPSSGTAFCNRCGAGLRQAGTPPSQPEAIPAARAPLAPVASGPSPAMPAPQASSKGSPLTKILIGFAVVVVTVGAFAAGGVYYVVYRVKQKVHEVTRNVPGMGSSSDSGSNANGGIMGSISKMVSSSGNSDGGSSGNSSNGGISGDLCRLLSKAEVGRAIGVEIVATETTEGGCSYLARGNSGDMTAKHMAAMMGTKGADAKTQQTIQNLSGGLFKAFQSEGHDIGMDSNGNVPVFTFGVDNHSAEAQMRLNAKVLGGLSPGQEGIPGIGDQAFDEAGAMMMVRKGDKLVRIMYSTCPCSADAIKPLAKMLADRL